MAKKEESVLDDLVTAFGGQLIGKAVFCGFCRIVFGSSVLLSQGESFTMAYQNQLPMSVAQVPVQAGKLP
jgi:hypothetical protein